MSHVASFESATTLHREILVGGLPPLTNKFTLLAGVLAAGAVLGRVVSTPTAAAASGNVGNGSIGAVTTGAWAIPGVWRVMCTEPASGGGGTFTVEDPNGVQYPRAVVGSAYAGPLGFTISAGVFDFAAGDAFLITVPTTTDVRLAEAAATDGSATPAVILAHDADASGGEVEVMAYTRADVREFALSYGAGHSAETVREALRQRGITLV